MQVRVSRHTLLRALKRGVSLTEIEDTLASGKPVPAAFGRLAREKVFPLNALWQGRFYAEKKVKVVYVIEQRTAWTVTVISYYGKWEN